MKRQTRILSVYIGAFLLSASTLIVEVALTRIFSVTIWYHFAFMVISIAMLGFGAAGAFLTVSRSLLNKDIHKMAAWLALLFSLTLIISLVVISRISLDPFQIIAHPAHLLKLLTYYTVLLVPFFMAGLTTTFLFFRMQESIGKIYFSNLVGAGAGCLGAVFLIPLFSNVGAVVFAALVAALAAYFFYCNYDKVTFLIAAVIILLCFLVVKAPSVFKFKIAGSKGLTYFYTRGASPLVTKWNAFAQIDVLNGRCGRERMVYAPGLSTKYPLSKVPEQIMILIDADALTPITKVENGFNNLLFLKYAPSALAYRLKTKPRVCVIGAGGGFDILTALSVGDATHVTAVEINPQICNIVNDCFRDFSGNLYRQPMVDLQTAEGRSFIHRAKEKFDVIQMSLVDTWAAASVGAYSLTENYLYTTQAFVDFINRLTDQGILTVTRWFFVPPKESLRLAALAFTALKDMGIAHPENHIVFIGSEGVAVLLLKKSEFALSDIEQIQEHCQQLNFQILYAPHIPISNIFGSFINCEDKEAFYKQYPFNITPPTDDKPFYFYCNSLKHMNPFIFWNLSSIDKNNISHMILLAALLKAVVLSLLFILMPLYFVKRKKGATEHSLPYLLWVYFGCLGIGFMFIEVTLIQKFILFLGHPIYSLSVVLFSLLASAGLGSLYSERIRLDIPKKIRIIMLSLVFLVLVYAFLLARLSYHFLNWGLTARIIISVLVIIPLGLLMGMPLPLGLRLVAARTPERIPWLWGINSSFSVMGSILSVIIAMDFGFSFVFGCAAFIYLLAMLIILLGYRRFLSSPLSL